MFGKLGKFLRLLGFDTEIADSKLEDIEIFQSVLKNNRILLTRDLEFYNYAQKKLKIQNLPLSMTIYLPFQDIVEELAAIFSNLNIDPDHFIWKNGEEMPFQTRCPKCNYELRKVKKENVLDEIPIKSAENFNEFWQCTNEKCRKIYWIGRHWEDIKKTIKKVQKKLK